MGLLSGNLDHHSPTNAEVAAYTAQTINSPQFLRKRPFVAPGVKNVQQVMASPPTVAMSTTSPFGSGQAYYATNQTTQSVTSPFSTNAFSVSKSGNAYNYYTANSAFPNQEFVIFDSVSATTTTLGPRQPGSVVYQISVEFSGTEVGIAVKGISGQIYAKVNDQYVTLTPTQIPANGTTNYYSLTFGAAVIEQRIDFIVSNIFGAAPFAGAFTAALTDTLKPAEIRGPRVIVIGDSLGTATGASGQAQGWIQVAAEYLGWDDIWPACIGGTGLTVGTTTGPAYQSRLQADAIAFNPDEIIIQGFQNDIGSTVAAVQAAATLAIQTIQAALPNCRITFFGPYAPFGVGYQTGTSTTSGYVGIRAAIAAAVTQANSPLVRQIDITNMPAYNTSRLPATNVPAPTLTSSPAAGATTFTTNIPLQPGQNYQFPDGSRCRVLSIATTTATVDKVQNAQTSGSVITLSGACEITGNGFSGATTGVGNADLCIFTDHIHRTNQGHFQMGCAFAKQYAELLNS